jgi:hypothetical protein
MSSRLKARRQKTPVEVEGNAGPQTTSREELVIRCPQRLAEAEKQQARINESAAVPL